jgi:hypothetical protein
VNILGLLVWYDEQPSLLATATHGLAKVADEIVAVDGAYALYPSATVRSHPDQAEAILRAAETEDVGVTIHRPRQLFFGNEIEKRNLSLQLARPFASDGDWVLVWDADYHLHHVEPDIVRHELEHTDKLAATYTIFEREDLMADPYKARYARDRVIDWRWTIRTRGIYKWAADLEYLNAHFIMRGTYQGVERYVYGPDLIGGKLNPESETSKVLCDAHDIGRALVVYHRRDERPLRRRQDAEEYYHRRDVAEVERVDFGSGTLDIDTGLPVAS